MMSPDNCLERNMEQANAAKLMDDLRVVVRDTEELLRATASQTGEKAEEARRRVTAALDGARVRLQEAQASAAQMGDEAIKATEQYVRENPWQAVGIAAGVGLVLGALLSRR
jgi:ElaB/YqjD/DUF883 family membrane-anchored ribosome-binding protein